MRTSLKDVFDFSVTFLEPLKYITIRFEEIITTHRRHSDVTDAKTGWKTMVIAANFTNFKLTEIMQVDTGSVLIFSLPCVFQQRLTVCKFRQHTVPQIFILVNSENG